MMLPPLPTELDNYVGWEPSSSKVRIAKVASDISPQDMWTHFISQRRPVVIDGHLSDPQWKGSKWTDLEYLRQTAGKVPVKIEPIHPSAGHFGTSAKRKQVAFSDYLDLLQQPESAGKWYLTTQYVDEDSQEKVSSSPHTDDSDSEESDYEPEQDTVLPSPTNALSRDFPQSPELLGSLVLQQCNLWLGNSKEGKSSGLHHDFHDNLYILLSGYKRFLLFPPSAHRFLHPRGLVDRVHPNGLIVYAPPGQLPSYLPGTRQQMPIRPDGLVPSDAARWRRKARLRVKRTIDEQAATEAGEGPKVRRHRKGKAKQTRHQEVAEEVLQQAVIELRLCIMDEQGIDPEADSSDEDDLDDTIPGVDDGEEDFSGSAGSDEGLIAEDGTLAQSEDSDSNESDDSKNMVRNLLSTLPEEMRAVALVALQGDPEAEKTLRAYMASLEEDESGDGNAGVSVSDSASSTSDAESLESGALESVVVHHPSTRKRATAASIDESSDSDTDTKSRRSTRPDKKVKIAPVAVEEHDAPDSEDYSGSEPESDDDDDDDDDEDSETAGMPLFPEGDSGSEFGDIDQGEADLENFLATSGVDDGPSMVEEDEEPSSFSQIPPSVLHDHFAVADDPSRPRVQSRPVNGNGRSRTEEFQPLSGCPRPLEVFLLPGQMLYLPASWYHEVTSSSTPPHHLSSQQDAPQHEPGKVHMALNYWFHPPDALDFEPVATAPSASNANGEPIVPGVGAEIGQSAKECLGSGTGTYKRPYRDAEVWDEVARSVNEQVQKARQEASQWSM